MVGKTTAAHGLQNTLWRGDYNDGAQGQRPLALSFFATRGGYTRRQLPLSLSLSLSLSLTHTHTLYTTNFIQQQHSSTHLKVCALSPIYTYMTFRHIYICVLLNRSRPIGTGSCISRFSVSSIRRDMFPNTLKYCQYFCQSEMDLYKKCSLNTHDVQNRE